MSTTTNSAFSVAFTAGSRFYTVTFPSLTPSTYYFNASGRSITTNDRDSSWVNIDDNWEKRTLTVNYALCTAPVAGNRVAWMDAFEALFV